MPVDFLTNDQKEGYGRYSYELNDAELAGCFHLDDADISFIKTRRGDSNRLGIALQLTTVRFLGTFLPDPTDVPISVIAFVADQIDVFETTCLAGYMGRKVTRYTHVNDIKRQYGYSEFNSPPWRFRLREYFIQEHGLATTAPAYCLNFLFPGFFRTKYYCQALPP